MKDLFSLTTLFRVTNSGKVRNPVTYSLRYISATSDENSLATSYLKVKCGLSAKSALLAAKNARFQTSERADEALSFFTNLGFSKSQLSRLVRAFPHLLAYPDPPKVFTPKIDFLLSKGVSSADLVKLLTTRPLILSGSLKDTIIPHFNYFKTLLGSDDAVVRAFKRHPDILVQKPQSYFEPNVETLRQFGVPESRITSFLSQQPRVLVTNPEKFRGVVQEVKRMSCDPLKYSFLMAIVVKISMRKSTWEKKVDIFKKWGWSDEDILEAFRRFPLFLKTSDDKINSGMDIFVNKLGWDSSTIAKFPAIIGCSLSKRTVPRCEVIRVLLSKGLIDKSVVTFRVFVYNEDKFLKKFVVTYEKEVPRLLKLYLEQKGILHESKEKI